MMRILMHWSRFALLTGVVLTVATAQTSGSRADAQENQAPAGQGFQAMLSASGWDPSAEELDEALEKWIDEFVVYVITDEERQIFENLPTREQKLAFTERFWDVRDPTPGTRLNEYRTEHLQRFAIANQRFSAGKPGWATDRGRIFIILGPPNNLTRNPMGRDGIERASEVWTYNLPVNPLLPGVFDLSFVDFHGTGEFELVSDLDAAAPIMTEQFGYVNSPLDVLSLRRHASSIYDERFLAYRFADPTQVGQDFLQFQQNLREVLRIPEIHKERLGALRVPETSSSVDFAEFPIAFSTEFYSAASVQTAIQTTIALEYNELQASPVGLNKHFSADVYAALERNGTIVDGTEKRLNFSLTDDELAQLGGTQILQSLQMVAVPGDYDLIVMARDNTSDRVGRRVESITVPDLSGAGLRLSSLTLASRIETARIDPNSPPRDFQHGDMRVVPNVNRTFFADQPVLLYFQAYGLTVDGPGGANRVSIGGEVTRNGERVREIPRQYPHGAPMTRQSFSLGLPLAGYRPGVYKVHLEFTDEVTGESAQIEGSFAVLPPLSAARER